MSFLDGQVFTEIVRLGTEEELEPHPLDDITDLELEEIRQLKHPPGTVQRVMECVHLILDGSALPPRVDGGLKWTDVLRTVVRGDFLRRVRNYNAMQLRQRPAMVDWLCRRYLSGENPLRPERVHRASRAVVAFFGWTVAVVAASLPEFPVEQVGGQVARNDVMELEQRRIKNARKRARPLPSQRESYHQERTMKDQATQVEQETVPCEALPACAEAMPLDQTNVKSFAQTHSDELQQAIQNDCSPLAEMTEQDSPEQACEEIAETKGMCEWDVTSNPDRRLLEIDGCTVRFPSDRLANFCNVLTKDPICAGTHFFEFEMQQIGDEQWCGVTADKSQAGTRVSGRNLRAWTYYCGRRRPNPSSPAGLYACRQVAQQCAPVVDGDVIGMVVDANRRAVSFLRNGELQGALKLAPTRIPLYVITHLDASSDTVALRKLPMSEAPRHAIKAMDSLFDESSQEQN